MGQRQLCWAHLKRNFQKLADRGGKAKVIGEAFLAIESRVFELWHLFRGGGMTRQELGDRMAPMLMDFLEVLDCGVRSRDRKTARFCRNLRGLFPALWTFVVIEGVEPTNNHGERVQRWAVLYRKNCFGCHSNSGCRFVERVLSVVQTLRLQKRSVLAFLKQTLVAHRTAQPKPQLVPAA